MSSQKGTQVLHLKDILKKENPSAQLLVYEHDDENSSSFYKKKREIKEERKSGTNKRVSKFGGEIKKTIEKIVKKNAGKKTDKTVGKGTIRKAKTPAGRVSVTKASTKKMNMGQFREYLDWFKTKGGKQSAGASKRKPSVQSKKATPKRSVSKGSRKTK